MPSKVIVVGKAEPGGTLLGASPGNDLCGSHPIPLAKTPSSGPNQITREAEEIPFSCLPRKRN